MNDWVSSDEQKIRINKPIVNLQLKWTTLQGSRNCLGNFLGFAYRH